MYSSHRIDSVTCLRLSSRCTAASRLGDAAVTLPVAVAGLGEQAGLQGRVREFVGQRPAQACGLEPPDGQPHCRGRRAHPPRNLAARQSSRLHPDHIAHTAHRKPLRRHPGSPFAKPKGTTYGSQKRPRHPGDIIPEAWATSSRNGWATSNRNGGRDHLEYWRVQIGPASQISPQVQRGTYLKLD